MSALLEPATVERNDPRLPSTPDSITVYSDLNCSFAHVAVYRLHQARRELGLDGVVHFDHRAFPLELFNESVNERPGVDSEIAVVGALEPDAGWRLWQGPDWRYPVSTLLALEAVQAVKAQGWRASEALDLALRRAFWLESRCITMRHEILAIAARTRVVDLVELTRRLDDGSARAAVIDQFHSAEHDRVRCSPHVFLHNGANWANPGVEAHWINGGFGEGYPVIDWDDPSVYPDLLRNAAELVR